MGRRLVWDQGHWTNRTEPDRSQGSQIEIDHVVAVAAEWRSGA